MSTKTEHALQFRMMLDSCTNMFGQIDEPIRKRLLAVFQRPCEATWDDSHSIIIGGSFMTLWQAWVATDADAPRSGKRVDLKGNVISGWPAIPTRTAIYKAVEHAVVHNHRN